MRPLKSEWQIFIALAVILAAIATVRDCRENQTIYERTGFVPVEF